MTGVQTCALPISWTGSTNNGGYGQVGYQGDYRFSHRLAYELLVGRIPDDLTLDHLCRNRSCCNPTHLEPVTRGENTRRGGNTIKTHCKNGHAYLPDNVYLQRKEGQESRSCLTCRKEALRRGRIRAKAKV